MELFGYDARDLRAAHRLVLGPPAPRRPRSDVEAAIARAIEQLRRLRGRLPRRAPRRRGALGRGARARAGRPGRRPARMLGAAYDTTAVHSAAERLGRVLETMSTAFFTLDRDWRFTYVNAAAERILGRRRDELVGQRASGRPTPTSTAPRATSTTARAMETGEPVSFEQYYPPLDTWFDVRATPERRRPERLLPRHHRPRARRAGARGGAARETGAATGRLQILSAASARLAGTLEVDELLRHPRRRRPQRLRRGPRRRRSTSASSTSRAARRRPIAYAAHGRRVRTRCWRAGRASRCEVDRFGARTARRCGELIRRSPDDRSATRPALALPLISRGRTLGAAVVIGAVEGALDRRVLVELAARAGVALDNAVLFGAERRLALTLQRSLLPTALPQLPGIELAARYLPGRRRARRRRRLLPRPRARGRPPAAGDRRRHGPRPAGRRADGPAARGARRLRLRRRPARPRARARLARARRRCWTCRWRPCWPAIYDPRSRAADVRAGRPPAAAGRAARRAAGVRRRARPARRWARA